MAKSANIYVAWISMNLETNDFFYQKTCIHKDLEETLFCKKDWKQETW